MRGALTLGRATPYMPADAVYVAVVDPGVGSERRSVGVRAASGSFLVGPDNGLLSLAWEALGGAEACRRDRLGPSCSCTRCRGRSTDGTCSPRPRRTCAAGWRSRSSDRRSPVDELRVLELPGPMVSSGAIGARVTGVDGFGNVQLNVTPADLDACRARPGAQRAGPAGAARRHLRRRRGREPRRHRGLPGTAGVGGQSRQRRRDARSGDRQDRRPGVTLRASGETLGSWPGLTGPWQRRVVPGGDHELGDPCREEQREQHDQHDQRRPAHGPRLAGPQRRAGSSRVSRCSSAPASTPSPIAAWLGLGEVTPEVDL